MDRGSGSERLTGALLDRLTHGVHTLEANGPSYRFQDAKRRLRGTRGRPWPVNLGLPTAGGRELGLESPPAGWFYLRITGKLNS